MSGKNGKKSAPSVNVAAERPTHDENGRFAKGNRLGPGNPLVKKTAKLRAALVRAVTPEQIEKIGKTLVRQAIAGDVAAIRELFDRLFGKAKQPISLTGDAARAARALTAAFDHAGYAKLFRDSCGSGGGDGGRAPPANGN